MRLEAKHLDALTLAEREVLACLGCAMTDKEIAGKLHVSFRTVQNQIRSLVHKLPLITNAGSNRRVRLALIANAAGFSPAVDVPGLDQRADCRARRQSGVRASAQSKRDRQRSSA